MPIADVVKHHLFSQIILNRPLPDHIFNVEVRYKYSDLDAACSKLTFEGYVESSEKPEKYILQRLFNAGASRAVSVEIIEERTGAAFSAAGGAS
jgi:hypothetical protein